MISLEYHFQQEVKCIEKNAINFFFFYIVVKYSFLEGNKWYSEGIYTAAL